MEYFLFLTKKIMKVFTSEQIKKIEEYTIKNRPIASIDLMEEAAAELLDPIVECLRKKDDTIDIRETRFYFVCGPGNNGGDGLALSRMYKALDFDVLTVFCQFSSKISPECKTNLNKLKRNKNHNLHIITDVEQLPDFEDRVIIDCIFGNGLNREVLGKYAEVIEKINESQNTVVSVDIPSGLFGEDNSENNGAKVRADFTLNIGYLPLSSLFAENEKYFGETICVKIGFLEEIEQKLETPYYVIIKNLPQDMLVDRKRFAHKGDFGHALLIAGSYGKGGAAILAAKACMRMGVGLLTVHVPEKLVDVLQISIPEAMLSIDENEKYFSQIEDFEKYNVIGIGPGLGLNDITKNAFANFLKTNTKPLVIDADGLNIISENKELLKYLKPGTILTPHPKEFERLFGKFDSEFKAIEFMRDFSKKTGIIIVRKSGVTAISTPEAKVYFNTIGNPGMATAGSGDVLTGMITSLLAQNYSAQNATLLAVYIHANAGDFASFVKSQETMIASDIIDHLGNSFNYLRNVNSPLSELFDEAHNMPDQHDEFFDDYWADDDEDDYWTDDEDDEVYLN